MATGASADLCLLLEGTYPYVSGGVSAWVHQILLGFPQTKFNLLHIAPYPDAYGKQRYTVPDNVGVLGEIFCHSKKPDAKPPPVPKRPKKTTAKDSRLLRGLRRLHLESTVDDQLLEDLGARDVSPQDFLHGAESFDLICDLYDQMAAGASFVDVFWHLRAMHVPILRLLNADIPEGRLFHAVSTGYAGLVGAVASVRTDTPLLLTEHGLYAREREMELARADWIDDGHSHGERVLSPVRAMWTNFFGAMSRIAYYRSEKIVTLSGVNLNKQVADGADPDKCSIIPNGVDVAAYGAAKDAAPERESEILRLGFVGRVVPIKDVMTLIRAMRMALHRVKVELWVIGPTNEDPTYAKRCEKLADRLGVSDSIDFMGPQSVLELYPQLDALILTSISEGQPLVMLEGYAAEVPAIATDVGACREMIEGRPGEDADLGPSGLVTRVANPEQTADAIVQLAMHPEMRKRMGRAARERVNRYYQLSSVVAQYGELYQQMVKP